MTRVENLGARSDHPRSRGEYQDSLFSEPSDVGSSPLSRGIHNAGRKDVPFVRIIPALAGNTGPNGTSNRSCTDHPRSRGEYHPGKFSIPDGKGSSPLSRGIRGRFHPAPHRGRIIPALAGNTTGGRSRRRQPRDHPRSRGEYCGAGCVGHVAAGSSPLSRGIHLLTRDFISRTCRILGTPSSHVSASRSHSPRVCDGRPPGGVGRLVRHLKDLDGPSGSAPRSRLVPMDHPMSGRTYLARSWHGTP